MNSLDLLVSLASLGILLMAGGLSAGWEPASGFPETKKSQWLVRVLRTLGISGAALVLFVVVMLLAIIAENVSTR